MKGELTISYKIVCDECKEPLDFGINFPDTLHGMEELSIKPCDCQSEQLKTIKQTITEIKQSLTKIPYEKRSF